MPSVNVGNKTFAFSERVLRFYPNLISRIQKCICTYSYKLIKSHRIAECMFSALASKCWIFRRPLDMTPEFFGSIVKAHSILHAFVNNNHGLQLIFFYESHFGSIKDTRTTENVR